MSVLYELGTIDVFKNLRIILLVILIIGSISCILKIKSIIANYNYINKDMTILENLQQLSDAEFICWTSQYILKKGFDDLKQINNEASTAIKKGEKAIIIFNKKYSMLDINDAKYYYGYCLKQKSDLLVIVTTAKVDKYFYEFLNFIGIKYQILGRNEFNRSYRSFIQGEFNNKI